jgi:hypothetical protein
MYEDIDKYKEKKRYLSVPKRKEKYTERFFSVPSSPPLCR